MQHYCLAFAFDDLGRVALIKKNRPQWQLGRWNGVGGRLGEDELPEVGMTREFLEETGVTIHRNDWIKVGEIEGHDFFVNVYTVSHAAVRSVRTMTDEQVDLFMKLPSNCIGNVLGMVSLIGSGEGLRKFKLFY